MQDRNPNTVLDATRSQYKIPKSQKTNDIRADLPAEQRAAVIAEANTHAARAKKAEKTITPALQDIVGANGGEFERLDSRLKESDSLARKIADGVVEGNDGNGMTPEDAGSTMRDSGRSAVVLPDNGYWDAGTAVGDQLEAAGFQRRKQTEGWDPAQGYAGRNDTFIGPDGVEFEVQFHTRTSLDAAERNHELYNLSRHADTPPQAAWDLEFAQAEYLRANVPVPDGTPIINGNPTDHIDATPDQPAVPEPAADTPQAKLDNLMSRIDTADENELAAIGDEWDSIMDQFESGNRISQDDLNAINDGHRQLRIRRQQLASERGTADVERVMAEGIESLPDTTWWNPNGNGAVTPAQARKVDLDVLAQMYAASQAEDWDAMPSGVDSATRMAFQDGWMNPATDWMRGYQSGPASAPEPPPRRRPLPPPTPRRVR